MAYDRINWEDLPSTGTPISADNLNTMDRAIDALDEALESVRGQQTNMESDLALLDARMDTFVTLPSGSTSGNAELIDGRVDDNGTTHTNIGSAIRYQARNVIKVSDTQPTESFNRIWLQPDTEEIEIPTMEDLSGLFTVEGTKLIIGGNNG